MSNPPETDFLRSLRFIAFDTETTGLWAAVNRLVEIAGVSFSLADDKIETFETLIFPQRPIPSGATTVHGITDDMVYNAPTADQALTDFFSFCGDSAILIAHNVPFDLSFLQWETRRHNLTLPNLVAIDTVDICRKLFKGIPSYSLQSLMTHFNLAQHQDHRALSDAQLVRQLFQLAAEKFPPIDSVQGFRKISSIYPLPEPTPLTATVPDNLRDLQEALAAQKRVRIKYTNSVGEETERVIAPRWIHELKSSLYVTAWCELTAEERTFRLDRITEIKLIQEASIDTEQ